MSRKSFQLFILFILFVVKLSAQNVVVFQGFEGTMADNWSYTSPSQGGGTGQIPVGLGNYGGGYAKTGSFSMRAGGGSTGCGSGSACCVNGATSGGGCNNLPNGKTVQFSAVNVECLSGVQISVAHRSHILCSGQGEGFDAGESVFFEVSLNGGSWTTVGTLGGSTNYTWTYSTNPAGGGATVANPFIYNVPAGTVSVAFRTRSSNTDRADEVYYIDDVKLTTTTNGYNFPGTAGLWLGKINTDWNNKCNWEDRTLPLLTTDVYIPNGANNICEVLSSQTGNCRNLLIDKSKLAVEYFSSTLNVNGNLTIDNNGELDMSLAGLEGGTLNISGNWLNKRDETFFTEGLSTVNFTGLTNQTITVINDTKELFYKASINKGSGTVTANTDIWIDNAIAGATANLFTLSNGLFDLNSHALTIWNPNFQAISRTGGGIVSEKTDNASKIIWKMNSNTGNYVYPFIRTDGVFIPFTFNHIIGNAGDVTLATYGTPPNNLPWPVTPDMVTNLNSFIGLTPDNRDATVDRFWQIDVSGSATANLTFVYAPSELPVAPFNNANTLKAQRYATSSNQWQPYLPAQTAGANFVSVPNVSTFSPWTLTSMAAPLPVSLLTFNAEPKNNNVMVVWETTTEINNDYFTILRSKDGINFEAIGRMDGAVNSSNILNYEFTDQNAYDGVSFYQLKQTDLNGLNSFSKVVAVNLDVKVSTLFSASYFDHRIDIKMSDNEASEFVIQLSDVLGNSIYTDHVINKKDQHHFFINTSDLSKGVYFVKAESKFKVEVKKIFIY